MSLFSAIMIFLSSSRQSVTHVDDLVAADGNVSDSEIDHIDLTPAMRTCDLCHVFITYHKEER